MRKLKRWMAFLLITCMTLSMGISAFAEESASEKNETLYQVKINGGNGQVQFINDGEGHSGTSNESEFAIKDGMTLYSYQNVILDVPTRDGFTFDGWAIADYSSLLVDTSKNFLKTDEVINYTITSNIAFVAQWIENEDGNTGNNSGTETPVNQVNIVIDANSGIFKYTRPDGTSEILTDSGTDYEAGKTLAELGYYVTDVSHPDGNTFLYWDIQEVVLVYDDDGNAVLDNQGNHMSHFESTGKHIGINDITNYKCDKTTRFLAVWEGQEQGGNSGEQGNHVSVMIEGLNGKFHVIHPTESNTPAEDTEMFGTGIEVGSTLGKTGYVINDPVFFVPERQFEGWLVGTLVNKTDDMGNLYMDFEQFNNTGLMTTAEMLAYVMPDNQEQIMFRAQWAGEDDQYYSDVFLDGYYGEFCFMEEIHDGSKTEITSDNWGCGGLKIGSTVYDELGFELTKEPTREGYTFEGWLEFRGGESFELISDKIYTTEQILKEKKIPDYPVVYTVKWKEMSIQEYIDNASGGDDNFIINANGGQIDFEIVVPDGSKESMAGDFLSLKLPENVSLKDYLISEGISSYHFAVTKDNYTYADWTVYVAEELEIVEVDEGERFQPEESDSQVMYVDHQDGMDIYLVLKKCQILDDGLSSDALLEVSSNMYVYAVANWIENTASNEKDEKYVLDIQSEVKIPESAKEKYNSVDAMKEALREQLLSNDTIQSDEAEVVFMEITLMITKADGTKEVVTEENFLEEGVIVVIPYPEGTDKDNYDFMVTHLISSGEKAGQIEVLHPEKKDNGLHVHVYSLSPFAVAYQEADTSAPSDKEVETETETETTKPTDSPSTGDTMSKPMMVMMSSVMVLSAAAMVVMFMNKRKRFMR